MNIPPLTKVDSKYGAPMGRPNRIPDSDTQVTLAIYALAWVDGDYDGGGAYWGSSGGKETIYRAVSEDAETEVFVRALGVDQAIEKVLELVPKAKLDSSFLLEEFFHHFLIAALWSSTDDEGNPLDANHSAEDIDPVTRAALYDDCFKFLQEAISLISAECGKNPPTSSVLQQAGHDFWLTRCGHGSGFFDGDWPISGDDLAELSNKYGNVDLYAGDDGKIYA